MFLAKNPNDNKMIRVGGQSANYSLEKRVAGLYDAGRLVKTWQQLKDENPRAFAEEGKILGDDFSSILNLTGSLVIDDEITEIGNFAFESNTNLIDIILPETITIIGDDAFTFCGIRHLFIPKNVASIGDMYYLSDLETIKVDADNPIYDSRNDCNAIIETATNKLIYGCKGCTIPSSVVELADYAFQGSTVENISFPSSITEIPSYCFQDSKLKVLSTGPIINIGREAFKDSKLDEVYIFNNLRNIGIEAFNCPSLRIAGFVGSYTGWSAGGSAIPSTDLRNESLASKYLKETYVDVAWVREV